MTELFASGPLQLLGQTLYAKKLTRNMSQKEWDEWVSPDIPYKVQCPGMPIPES